MKKVLVVLLLLAVAGGGIFAQTPGISLRGEYDMIWVPLQMVTEERVVPGTNPVQREDVTIWGTGLGRDSTGSGDGLGEAPRFRLWVTGGNDYIGFNIEFRYLFGGANFVVGDDAFLRVNPTGNQLLTIKAGVYRDTTLRGRIPDHWMHHFTLRSYNQDEIFTRSSSRGDGIGNVGELGVLLMSKPIDDLTIMLSIPGLRPFHSDSQSMVVDRGHTSTTVDHDDGLSQLGRVMARMQVGFGYNIAGIGLARFQFVGANKGVDLTGLGRLQAGMNNERPLDTGLLAFTTPRLEFAFALTMVDGLVVDLGFKYHLPVKSDQVGAWVTDIWEGGSFTTEYKWANYNDRLNQWEAKPSFGLSVGAIYNMKPIVINTRIDTKFAGSFEETMRNGQTHNVLGKVDFPFELNFRVWPTYDLGFIIVGLDLGIGYYRKFEDGNGTFGKTTRIVSVDGSTATGVDFDGWDGGVRFGIGAFVRKNFGAGNNFLQGGLAFSNGAKINGIKENTTFSIPIYFHASF